MSFHSLIAIASVDDPQRRCEGRQIRRWRLHQIREVGSALHLVLARQALVRRGSPRAVESNVVEQRVDRDLRRKLGGEAGKAVLALPLAEIAAEAH